MVRYRLDPDNPPQMTEEQMQALRDLRDEDIDLSDIPEQPTTGWRRVSELVPAENKQQITLRLDADVIAFSAGPGGAIKAASMQRCASTSTRRRKPSSSLTA